MSDPSSIQARPREPVLLLLADPTEIDDFSTALSAAGVEVSPCSSVADFCKQTAHAAAVGVIGQECLAAGGVAQIESTLREQAAWSDFALILLTSEAARDADQVTATLEASTPGQFTVLERPLSPRNLANVVRLSARARGREVEQDREKSARAQSNLRVRLQASRMGERIREQSETLRLLRDVATASNSAESVEEALSFALAQVCRHTGWDFGHAYLPSSTDPAVLLPVDASYEHAPGSFAQLREATLELQMQRGTRLAGRVFANGRPEWSRGIARELDPRRARLAEELDLVSIAAFPILSGANVVGVLEFFSADFAEPDATLLDTMASVGTQLGRVIERDRMDRALRESVWFIEKISETSPTMIRVFDLQSNRYVFVNKQMARFFGTPVDEMLAYEFDQFLQSVHPEDVDRARWAKNEVSRHGPDVTITWQARMRNAAGEWRWVRSWSVQFAPAEDQPANQVLSISMDVTDEVERAERLRQTERLTSIGTLAAGIAHEINNPLASVVMTAQLLRRRGLGEDTNRMLEHLIEDARRCGRIVRNVQRFARQEPSERRQLDLNSVIRAAEELSRTELRHAGIKLHMDLADELPPVGGDATELEQVVLNLITNAAHASERGQELVLRSSASDGLVSLSVQDEGRGMPPEVKRHAFDPFYTTRSREGGTGLGLSIAHGIIADHGGSIEIESEIDVGTTVIIQLPAQDDED